jgi:hypothetical protein
VGDSHHKIDTTHLVHELHSICQEDPSTRLNFVALEQLTPAVFTGFLLQLQGFEHVPLLLGDPWAFGRSIIDSAQYFQGFLVSSTSVEVPWRFGKAKDQEDDDLPLSTDRGSIEVLTKANSI